LRIKIVISYDGSRFDGFAPQPHGNTVINLLENIFKKSVNLDVKFTGSGRTDKGVHATNQVLHTNIPDFWEKSIDKLKNLINTKSMPYIAIKSIKKVHDNFHSRFSAKKRIYRYIISTKDISVFQSSYITKVDAINLDKIQESIKEFQGIHDFSSFRKKDPAITNCTRHIFKTRFYKYKDYYIFYFEATGFLRSQIRIMVDFLLKISDNELTINDLKEQLANKKVHSNTLAKPNGLYLAKIKY
jgi:tRNA pseudouridine38-40 synthase